MITESSQYSLWHTPVGVCVSKDGNDVTTYCKISSTDVVLPDGTTIHFSATIGNSINIEPKKKKDKKPFIHRYLESINIINSIFIKIQ